MFFVRRERSKVQAIPGNTASEPTALITPRE